MLKLFSLVCLFCAMLFQTASAQTPQGNYTIDRERSRIGFEADSTLHPFKGEAKRFSGSFSTQGDFSQATGVVEVEVQHLLTGNKGLDRNMHRMFDVPRYPLIIARVESIALSGTQAASIKGVLRVRDVEKPFSSAATLEVTGDSVRLKGSAAVSVKELGLRPPVIMGLIRVADAVKVVYDVVLVRGE